MWIPFAILSIVSVLALVCGTSGGTEEKPGTPFHLVVPINYALLLVFTISTSMVVSKISLAAQADRPGVVLEAVMLTAAAVLGITMYAVTGF
jgi:FtsH-binding integral membrane protein